jgi:hypothetical protein
MRLEETYRSQQCRAQTYAHIRSDVVPGLMRAGWDVISDSAEVMTLRRLPRRLISLLRPREQDPTLVVSLGQDGEETTVQVTGPADPLTKAAFDRSPLLRRTMGEPENAGARTHRVGRWLVPSWFGVAPLTSPGFFALGVALALILWALNLAGLSAVGQVIVSLIALWGFFNLHRMQAERNPARIAIERLGSLRSFIAALLCGPLFIGMLLVGLLTEFPGGVGIWIFASVAVAAETRYWIVVVRLW